MIVAMKKVALIVQSKDSEAALETLSDMGVVHVEHQQLPAGQDIAGLQEEIALADEVINILSQEEYSASGQAQAAKPVENWKFIAKHIVDSRNRIHQLEEYSRNLMRGIAEWEEWGDFDPESIAALEQKGLYLGLYRVPAKELGLFPKEVIIEKISCGSGIVNCAVIARVKPQAPFKELALPKMSLGKMRLRLAEDNKVRVAIEADIRQHSRYKEALASARKSLEGNLEFHRALSGMGKAGEIVYLVGYAPFDAVEALLGTSRKEGWGFLVSEPLETDNVPTLIRNPRWVSIIAPVFKLIEVIPGYRELDISFWFLFFFSIFFGMLIGDAGYGIIFLLLTYLAQRKFGVRLKDKSVFILFYLLNFCAIIWGILTATFFGQAWLPQSVQPLLPALRSDRNLQILCFFLGATQLSVAHLWRLVVKFPSLSALSELGWFGILWAAFFLAKTLILGEAFPEYGSRLIIFGAVLVVLFSQPRKNIAKGIGLGLGSLLLNLVSNFTDIVSYIRLFAVGLATVAVADAFNSMAMGVGYNNVLSGLIATLILLVGHLLNIVLGPLAILVHGVRLNVLEFCNHLDIKWSGFAYRPLRKEIVNS